MDTKDSISDVPKDIQNQGKATDEDSDKKAEQAGGGGGGEMGELEEVSIRTEIAKVDESHGKVLYQETNGDAAEAVAGVTKRMDDKVSVRMNEVSSGAGGNKKGPKENSADDLVLLQIFPEEIWEKVTDFLDDGDDLYNLSKSSPFFEDLLAPKKVLYLFPSVWEVLGKKFFENNKKPGVYNELYSEEYGIEAPVPETTCGCGGRRRARTFSGILKLREVSKIWNNAVDKFIRNGSLQECHDQVALPAEASKWNADWADDFRLCENTEVLTRFRPHFDETHAKSAEVGSCTRSPFLSGKVGLRGDPTPVMAMLQDYGHLVQQCQFGSWNGNMTPVAQYSIYCRAMELMPNLKMLGFIYGSNFRKGKDAKGEDDLLLEEMTMRPVPVLKHIQLLAFYSGDPKVFSSVLRINNHVSTLITGYFLNEDFDMYTIPLPCLKRLKMEYGRYQRIFQTFADSEFKSNLTHIELRFRRIPENLSAVPDVISKNFGDSLTDLQIVFRAPVSHDTRHVYQAQFHFMAFNLPKLKKLIFKSQHYCSLEFLVSVKETLEYLEVHLGLFRVNQSQDKANVAIQEETIRFLSCTGENGSLLDSNIWEMFPKLKDIKFYEYTRDSCPFTRIVTRHDWELKMNQNVD